jgi:hypothetical protein
MPADALALDSQFLATLRNALRDDRFVPATVNQ